MRQATFLLINLVVAGLLSTQAALAQDRDFSKVQIIPHHVAGGIYYLEGSGGNIGLSVGGDGVVMIDDQFAPLTDKIQAAIRSLNKGQIRFLINTHIHGDHTGGNVNFGKMGIPIVARDEVRARLQASMPYAGLPVLTFDKSVTIHLNGERIHIISMPPAHTDGDAIIYFEDSDVIHCGDIFRTTGFPYVDAISGGSVSGTVEALNQVIKLAGANTKIIPGHGDVSSREDVAAFRDMIIDVVNKVKPMVARGMSYDQVAAADPTKVYDARYGDPGRFLRAVYAELKAGG